MSICETDILNFKNQGFVVIDDFLTNPILNSLQEIYETQNNWQFIEQQRDHHYEHVFKTSSPFLPNEDESYLAKFSRSTDIESYIEKHNVYVKYFKPAMEILIGKKLNTVENRCYKLESGDFYRTHIDDYAGVIASTYYINNRWIWDWGGILNIVYDNEGENVFSIFPKCNRVVFLDNKKFRFPHFITRVEDFSQQSRYTYVTFNK